MMVEKEDLGLSLSLGPHRRHHDHFHNVMPKSSTRALVEYWTSRPIDVNRARTTERADQSEEAGASSSSPNTPASTVSNGAGSGSGRGIKRGRASATMDHENETLEERACYSRGVVSDEEVDDADDGSRKKLRLSKDQSVVLEESFREHNTLNQKEKLALAKQLKLRARQVEVWFQNRRARTKLKQTEVDCELLRRCCENLTEQNRRLQKEVQELRALKITSPQLMYMHMSTPTTLTVCPSCQRISSKSPAASSSQPNHHHHRPTPPAGVSRMPSAPIPLRPSFPL